MGCAPGRNAALAEVQVRHMPHPGQCMWMQHAAGRESSVSPVSLWLSFTSVQCAGQMHRQCCARPQPYILSAMP